MSDVFATGRFPICPATHDQGVRWLFDLSTVLLLLDCQPGDRVLDLGAGSGFSSEMLARLGYDVVALDPDHTALVNNRRRPSFDRARIAGRVAVTRGVAEHLPFRDGSFDAVLGMNVLHHVPDLALATRELARVLVPGGRAAFCEPGLDHLLAEETQRAMQEHGEGDQPFDVLAFLRGARANGFRDAMLTATLQSPLRLLPIEEVELYRSGQHPRLHLRPEGVLDELHRRHAYAMLTRDGERPKTSRHPGLLRASIEVSDFPVRVRRGIATVLRMRATNTGDTIWLSKATDVGGYVTAGCKLLDPTGRLVDDAVGRTPLPADVPPGASISVEMRLEVPAAVAPGPYDLHVDLVNELVCWFADRSGGARPRGRLLVE